VSQLQSPQFRPGSFNPCICTAQVLVEVAVVELDHPVSIAAAAAAITFATELGDVAWIFKVELGDAATVPAVGTANAIAIDVDVGDVHGDVAFAV
jgi:proline racemase